MRYLRYLALLSIFVLPAAVVHAQVQNGYENGYGAQADPNYQAQNGAQAPGYDYSQTAQAPQYADNYEAVPIPAGEPVCQFGYYPMYPYGCAPYGYWAPNYFVDGYFLGAGPWFRGWGWRPAFGYGFRAGFRGEYGFRGGVPVRGGFVNRGFRGGMAVHSASGFRGAPAGGFRGAPVRSFSGGGSFHGAPAARGFSGGGGFHGGGGARGGGGGRHR